MTPQQLKPKGYVVTRVHPFLAMWHPKTRDLVKFEHDFLDEEDLVWARKFVRQERESTSKREFDSAKWKKETRENFLDVWYDEDGVGFNQHHALHGGVGSAMINDLYETNYQVYKKYMALI